MVGPQNNLDSVRNTVQSQHNANMVSSSVLPKTSSSKFKPALGASHSASNPITRQASGSSPSLPSFATPNFGRKTMNTRPATVSAPPRRDLIDLSREPTLEIFEGPVPSRKRQSLDAPEGAQQSASKRLKENNYVNKENIFITGPLSSKGKSRAVPRQWTPEILSSDIEASKPAAGVPFRPDLFAVPPASSETAQSDPSTQLVKNSDLDSRSQGFLELILGRNRQVREYFLKLISEHGNNPLDIFEVSFLLSHRRDTRTPRSLRCRRRAGTGTIHLYSRVACTY
ncbi:hypothetical protein DFH29DRAFT_172604 [Suillus ampliporus]|nr:hypothetical protein DFH29DRAFT_172604 [Suillus ampliporus]